MVRNLSLTKCPNLSALCSSCTQVLGAQFEATALLVPFVLSVVANR